MAVPEILLDENGLPDKVVMSWADYIALEPDAADMHLSDEQLYDKAKAEEGEYFPEEVVDALLDGTNPVKVYRKYRGFTQKQLAATIGHKQELISQIENGRRSGSIDTIKAIAEALSVDVGDLV
ncbi:helix-turn-helix domain-containing protein [Cohaesibacter celericrescens]|uniref:XRE family transcriptional regulator n=1 Tax=Cohaesibacter celericrescens TaxID=2067669 RepID=A0A2N5XTS5_9HYPH|nr:helix-turn-helix transcriptional regulator [Cohaesibacter celericrescens]PLW77880.1 XRE family transcriptional regulator [Cohaesibacter celericrescens]